MRIEAIHRSRTPEMLSGVVFTSLFKISANPVEDIGPLNLYLCRFSHFLPDSLPFIRFVISDRFAQRGGLPGTSQPRNTP
jgi:hypothetical protein